MIKLNLKSSERKKCYKRFCVKKGIICLYLTVVVVVAAVVVAAGGVLVSLLDGVVVGFDSILLFHVMIAVTSAYTADSVGV